jgi:cell division protein FtsQ
MSTQELLGRFRSRVTPGLIYARPGARGGVRRRPRRRLLASKPARRLAVAVVALAGVLGGGWLWLRDSSLVAVERVTVTGVSGPDAAQIRSALVAAGRTMSTLDVHVDRLRTAVAPYPVVRDVRVSTQFPHGLRIRVVEQLPVGALVAGGRAVAASADGTLLHDVPGPSLPTVPVPALPGGSRVTDPSALEALSLLAVTPLRMRSRIAQVTVSSTHGLTVQLRSGPSIYFGDQTRLDAKWTAATTVLADPSSTGASYIDVTDPERPVAGAGAQAVVAAGLATTDAQAAAGPATSAAGATASTTSSAASVQAAPNPAGGG